MKIGFFDMRSSNWMAGLIVVITGWAILAVIQAKLLISPYLFMDEGYYLGATHAILKGDFLLNRYQFDKPFLLAWMPIPGILLFGETPLGFHFVPLICMLGGFLFFFLGLQESVSKSSVASTLLNGVFSLYLYTLPAVRAHGVSNFCEPYLLFWGSLLLYGVSRKNAPFGNHALCKIFLAGFFTKFSFGLWAPVLGLKDYFFGLKKWPAGAKNWIRSGLLEALQWAGYGRWFLFAGILLAAWNAAPFSAVLWFAGMKGNEKPGFDGIPGIFLNFLSRGKEWSLILRDALGGWGAFAIIVAMLVYSLFSRKNRSKSPLARLMILAAALHLFAYPATGVQIMNRYIIQCLPLLLFATVLVLAEMKRLRWVVAGGALVSILAHSTVALSAIGGNPEPGRESYVLRSDLDRNHVVLSNGSLWVTAPFHDQVINSGCISENCLKEMHKGVRFQRFHFAMIDGMLRRVLPEKTANAGLARATIRSEAITAQELSRRVLGALRIRNAVTVDRIIEDSSQSTSDLPVGDLVLRPLYDGSVLRIQGSVKRGIPGLIKEGAPYEIRFRLGLNDVREVRTTFNQPRTTLMAKVLSVGVDGTELLDFVMPLFYRSYTIPILVLDRPWSEDRMSLTPKWVQNNSFEGVVYREVSLP